MSAYIIDPFYHRGPARNRIYRVILWLNKKKKLFLILSSGILMSSLSVMLLIYPQPPIKTIDFCRIALNQARRVDAETYAPVTFKEAEYYWKRTLITWRIENRKLFFNRDFSKVFDLAAATNRLAKNAARQAIQARDSLKNVAQIEMVLLHNKIAEFKARFKEMPIDVSSRARFNRGELLILEARSAFNRQDYKKCISRLKTAQTFIGKSNAEVSEMLESYLQNIPRWRQWAKETIEWSKNSNDLALVIDKMGHLCQVYHQGELIKKYPVELGLNWIGHKRQRGDNATPEGKYFIRKKIPPGQSKYYKALAIDYPNATDVANFHEAKRQGQLPSYAQIGGSIEIHGDGGKGINWTQGCIALKNEDMDSLFNMVKIGTPVTIVGSMNSSNQNAMKRSN